MVAILKVKVFNFTMHSHRSSLYFPQLINARHPLYKKIIAQGNTQLLVLTR